MDEFELIRRFFDRGDAGPGIVTGIGDDGAVLTPSPGTEQVQVIDTLVEGVHFPADSNAADIGYRVVAVNLSDIAAMGARPRWMTLALTLPPKDQQWLSGFANGLFAAASEFNVALVGGDTTSGDAVVVTVHMTGEVSKGAALLRSGARVGDTVFVSGTCGDAAAGLALQNAAFATRRWRNDSCVRVPVSSWARNWSERPAPSSMSPTDLSAISGSCSRPVPQVRRSTLNGCPCHGR